MGKAGQEPPAGALQICSLSFIVRAAWDPLATEISLSFCIFIVFVKLTFLKDWNGNSRDQVVTSNISVQNYLN